MKLPPLSILVWSAALPLTAQVESSPQWFTEIPVALANGQPSPPVAEPEPIDFEVLKSHTKRVHVSEASEMADLPPVEGTINVTVQLVKDPQLAEPPPLPPSPPQDPAISEALEEFRLNYRGNDLVFLSATVYDHSRTLLRIYPNGKMDDQLAVWINLDFNHFSGFSTYRVQQSDGTFHDHGLLMGLGNVDSEQMRESRAQRGLEFTEPEIPELPNLATNGPVHSVVEGQQNGAAMETLLQLQDLYRREGANMEAAFHAREQAYAERKAYLLANPPKPEDVVVQFWKRSQPSAAGLKSLEGSEQP